MTLVTRNGWRLGILTATFACSAAIWGLEAPFWKWLCGAVLLCFLPGVALTTTLFPAFGSLSILERATLSTGGSYALSALALFAVQFLPGELTLPKVILSLDLVTVLGLALGSFLPPVSLEAGREVKMSGRLLAGVIILLIAVTVLRFTYLGYSEFQDDELDVATAALRTILGEKEALFTVRKGPPQTLITAAFILFTGSFVEFVLRLPFALASLSTVLATYLLGRRMFGPFAAWAAGALLVLDGIYLAFSRIVQYQSIALLTQVLAFYAFYRFCQAEEEGLAIRFQLLGTLFFSFGCLTHYDLIPLGPALVFLYLGRGRWQSFRRQVTVLLASLIMTVSVLAPFYVPFFLSARQSGARAYIFVGRIGGSIYNHLPDFLTLAIFYDSVYYITFMGVVLIVFWVAALKAALAGRVLFYVVGTSLLAAFALALLAPSVLALDEVNYSFVLFLPAVLAVLIPRRMPLDLKALWLWFLGYFIVYNFLVRRPGLHQYTFSVAWALLVGAAIGSGWHALEESGRRRTITAFTLLLALWYIVCAFYIWLVFVQPVPQYALTYPRHKNPLYFTLHEKRPGEAFGFPNKSGWKTIAYLYMTGQLRGGFETNELYQKAQWYTRRALADAERRRYYLIAENPHRLQAGPSPSPFVAEEYKPIGEITVGGVPKLRLYERKTLSSGSGFTTYKSEEYEAKYDALRTLQYYTFYLRNEGDDHFFHDLAVYLEADARPGDGLILEAPEQAEILSYYYRGPLPYYPLPRQPLLNEEATRQELADIAARHERLYAMFWAVEERDPGRFVERWLAENLFKSDERWFGNVRLDLYAVPQGTATRTVRQPVGARVGDKITLLGYQLETEKVNRGDILLLTLFWQCSGKLERNYKVFLHLVDENGNIVSQRDAEPVGGMKPTTSWQADETIIDRYGLSIAPQTPPGSSYQLLTGLYDGETGQRLPVFDSKGQRLAGDMISLSDVQIVGPAEKVSQAFTEVANTQ